MGPRAREKDEKQKMKIVIGYPPNHREIKKRFNLTQKGVIFTYGNFIFNPDNWDIPYHLLKHEATHARQQAAFGNVDEWWDKYMADDEFRLDMEIEAYYYQYQYFCKNKKDPMKRQIFLQKIAHDLSSSIYGNIISFEDAMSIIPKGKTNEDNRPDGSGTKREVPRSYIDGVSAAL